MLSEFLHTYPLLLWTLLYTAAAAIVLSLMWDRLKWWWLNTWYAFPVIGKLARLSKDLHQSNDGSGWFKSERTLCQDYKAFIQVQSEYDFEQRMTYLQKAGDNGRSTTPLAIWVLVIGFVFVEAQGFSYVLAGYTVPGASETTQQYASIGIAFIISALCVFATHFAGHELYRSLKIRRARKDWIEEGKTHALHSGSMALSKPQHGDDGQPEYTQVCNRVGKHASFVVSWVTLAFVVAIAVGATYVRVQSANKLMDDSVRMQKSELIDQRSATGGGLDMGQPMLIPEADMQSDLAADGKAVDEAAQYDLHGYWVTFAILAVLFVALQALGVLFGYRWGFAGENSKEAFKSLGKGKFQTYGDVRTAAQQFIDKAQNQLENLQQRMIQRHAEEGSGKAINPNRNFLDFLDGADHQQSEYRNRQRRAMQAEQERVRDDAERAQRASTARADAAVPAAPASPVASPAPLASSALAQSPSTDQLLRARTAEVEAAIRELDRLVGDAEQRATYLTSLPDVLIEEVTAALRERKESQQAARKQRLSQIEDLL